VTVSDSMRTPPGHAARIWLGALPLLQVMILWVMAIYGAFDRHALNKDARLLFIASILCILLPSAAPLAQSRFRVPAVPVLSALAAAGVIRLRAERSLRQEGDGDTPQKPGGADSLITPAEKRRTQTTNLRNRNQRSTDWPAREPS
jgi:hypothetical protein